MGGKGEDVAGRGFLGEEDDVARGGWARGEWHRGGGGGGGEAGEDAGYGDVGEGAAGVFAAADLRGVRVVGEDGEDFGGFGERGAGVEGEGELAGGGGGGLDVERGGGRRRGGADGGEERGAVGAENLAGAVDDRLRGVNAVELEALAVGFLALGEGVGGEGVGPAEVVPVGDVLGEAEDEDAFGSAGVVELAEEGVGGRAAGAAFGGEELDESYALRSLRGGGLGGYGEGEGEEGEGEGELHCAEVPLGFRRRCVGEGAEGFGVRTLQSAGMSDLRRARMWWERPAAMFAVGLALRVVCILVGHTYRIRVPMNHFGFGWEMGRIAQSVVLGQGYANPFNGPSGPTAWTPPLYPLLMAASFKMFGIYTNAAALFLLVVNSVVSAGIAPAVYEIGWRCFDAVGVGRREARYARPVAVWAGWLWAVYPAALQYAIHWIWEMSVSAFLFSWVIVLALRLRGVGDSWRPAHADDSAVVMNGAPGSGWMLWGGLGVIWGLIGLSNASLLPVFGASLVWILWPRIRQRSMRGVVGAVLACVCFALVMMPWWVRNERAMGAFVATRSNLGVELYESSLASHDAFPWGTAMPLWSGDPEFQRFVRMGEVPYAKARGAEAKARLRADPGQFWRFTRDRFLFFWDGTPHAIEGHPWREFFRNLSYAFLSLCGLLGLGLAVKRKVPGVPADGDLLCAGAAAVLPADGAGAVSASD